MSTSARATTPLVLLLSACTALATGCATTASDSVSGPTPASAATSTTDTQGAAPTSAPLVAGANLAAASGSLVSGKLSLMPMNGGVHITGEVGGLAPNSVHGIHVHETGDCSAADASSAGGHFNPATQPHGKAGAGAHHAGDMDNLTANADGVARVSLHLAGVTLGSSAANDVVGRAVVVHAAPDDYRSQPAGNSGARVACGVVAVTP